MVYSHFDRIIGRMMMRKEKKLQTVKISIVPEKYEIVAMF